MIDAPEDGAVNELFRCDTSYEEDHAVVLPRGEIDLATAPLLLRSVRETLALPITAVTVDLRHVSFLDSSGIHALLTARSEADDYGTAFRVASVQPQARRVLEVTNLAETFGLMPRADGTLPKATGGAAA